MTRFKLFKFPYQKGKIKYRQYLLAKEEIKSIKEFLNSKEKILHICGKPGTGKTLTIKHILKNKHYNFYNAYSDLTKLLSLSIKIPKKLTIIDEFDILEKNHKKESEKIIESFLKSKHKLITISNYLGSNENVLFFKPYTSEEIEEILLLKFKNELKNEILNPIKIKIIAKKSTDGDLRKTFDKVINELAGENEVNIEEESNVHKEIVKEIVNRSKKKNQIELYEIYLEKCKELKIKAYERSDFILVCDSFD
ncbi:hypothetical protein TUBRATIS_28040 [Tubulinosema ratisbonensis]|uniref:Cdc6/ORC1-like ATPase lid domain-containing protein n=1 Tax=Tubulinosema ratisbonensis TaxID=291195 RepID=A0A437AHX3_9MICR|nr:hypothetical protein TUBRATIS_28040 [Tubulinosema ratisbonensis]